MHSSLKTSNNLPISKIQLNKLFAKLDKKLVSKINLHIFAALGLCQILIRFVQRRSLSIGSALFVVAVMQ